jgi:hypothetical protein
MSLSPQHSHEVPEETAIVARAAFPKGNVYIWGHSISSGDCNAKNAVPIILLT